MRSLKDELSIKLMVVGIAVNFGIAAFVAILKLPVYLDAIGTILVTLLLGWRAGIISGSIGFLLMTVTGIGPFHVYFIGTQIAIALFTAAMAYQKLFSSVAKTVISGLLMGIVAAIVSAPIIVLLFGGVEGNGAGLITAFLISTGNTIVESVIYKGLSVEPLDKILQCLLVYFTLKAISKKQLKKMESKLIHLNFLDDK